MAALDATLPDLPREVLLRVLTHHADDVRTLCAAACLSRGWNDAAHDRTLWRAPDLGSGDLGTPAAWLDAHHLRSILATGGVEELDLTRCAASGITAHEVADALEGAPPLRRLRVRGLPPGDVPPGAPANAVARLVAALRPEDRNTFRALDAVSGWACGAVGETRQPCGRLCGALDVVCVDCRLIACEACASSYKEHHRIVLPKTCNHLCAGCWDDFFMGEVYTCEACAPDAARSLCLNCYRTCCGRSAWGCELSHSPLCFACADRLFQTCDVCRNEFCTDCLALKCQSCGRAFCHDCAQTTTDVSECCALAISAYKTARQPS